MRTTHHKHHHVVFTIAVDVQRRERVPVPGVPGGIGARLHCVRFLDTKVAREPHYLRPQVAVFRVPHVPQPVGQARVVVAARRGAPARDPQQVLKRRRRMERSRRWHVTRS